MAEVKIKLLLIGAPIATKIVLIERFIKNRYKKDSKLISGVDILTKDVEFKLGLMATLSIWDISQQDQFKSMRKTHYRGADGALLVIDLRKKKTFEEIKKWYGEIKQTLLHDIPVLLIGNHSDLVDEGGFDIVNRNKAQSFANQKNGIFIETSIKTRAHVDEAINELTLLIVEKKFPGQI